jgi:hypothetical protein
MWGGITFEFFLSEMKVYEYMMLSVLWFSINALLDCPGHRSARNTYLSFIAGYMVVQFGWLFAMLIWPASLFPRLGRSGVYAIATGLSLSAFGELLAAFRKRCRLRIVGQSTIMTEHHK